MGVSSVSHKKYPDVFFFVLNIATHSKRIQTQLEVAVKKKNSSSVGSPDIICSKLALVTLNKRHNYTNFQAHSQSKYQAYRRLKWRDHKINVGVRVEFGIKMSV